MKKSFWTLKSVNMSLLALIIFIVQKFSFFHKWIFHPSDESSIKILSNYYLLWPWANLSKLWLLFLVQEVEASKYVWVLLGLQPKPKQHLKHRIPDAPDEHVLRSIPISSLFQFSSLRNSYCNLCNIHQETITT